MSGPKVRRCRWCSARIKWHGPSAYCSPDCAEFDNPPKRARGVRVLHPSVHVPPPGDLARQLLGDRVWR